MEYLESMSERKFQSMDGQIEKDYVGKILGEPLTMENEKKVWGHMRSKIYEALKIYPTTIEEDEMLLQQSSNLSINEINCIKLRYQDKRVLYGLLDLAIAFDKVSEMTKTEAEEWLVDKHVGDYEYFEIKSADVYF